MMDTGHGRYLVVQTEIENYEMHAYPASLHAVARTHMRYELKYGHLTEILQVANQPDSLLRLE